MKIDKKYLPSKTFSIVILITIIFFTVISASLYRKENSSIYKNPFAIEKSSLSKWTKIKADSDSDGLEDWKEILYGTDTRNKDTDSDGTDDGEEIQAGRNPKIKNTAEYGQNPNDFMDKVVVEEYQSHVRENLYIPYTSIIKDKIKLGVSEDLINNKNIIEVFAQNTLENIPGINYEGTTEVADLTIVDPTEETIKDYLRFYALETKNIALFLEKDIDIITTSKINEVDGNKLIDLLSFTKENFKKAHLPGNSDWGLTYHLKIINKLEEMYSEIKDIQKTFGGKDDIMYYATLDSYYSSRDELISTLQILDNIFGLTR